MLLCRQGDGPPGECYVWPEQIPYEHPKQAESNRDVR